MEEEFIRNQERLKPQEEKNEEERSRVGSSHKLRECFLLRPNLMNLNCLPPVQI